jgi:tRNA-splicing ligase RtcB
MSLAATAFICDFLRPSERPIMAGRFEGKLERMDANRWRIPRESYPGMRVDGIVYANDALIGEVVSGGGLVQVANVAMLPGIVMASLAMPDIHWGYGFCIGGVAATDIEAGGVVSPGGVGYDINCGVRLIRSDMPAEEVRPRMKDLVDQFFRELPVGVGVGGPFEFARQEMKRILAEGSRYVAAKGLATQEDLAATESGGCLEGADPEAVSQEAYRRGADQCGTLGSGNHFAEVQYVETVYDRQAAEAMGLKEGNVTFMIHCGSRGLGHQVCDDYIRALRSVPEKYGIRLPDRQLVCAPVDSPPGRQYLGAMRAAANFAWANRQLLVYELRKLLERFFGTPAETLGLRQVYDVAHNIAKIETHTIGGRRMKLCVHRKGATRAFPPGHEELPEIYRAMGQPVLIPGDMGRASYVLVGTREAMEQAFGSTCHGAGRVLSRQAAIAKARGRRIEAELAAVGVIARAHGRTSLAEEQPQAYKDVEDVVNCVVDAGLSRKVARLRPMGVIKG